MERVRLACIGGVGELTVNCGAALPHACSHTIYRTFVLSSLRGQLSLACHQADMKDEAANRFLSVVRNLTFLIFHSLATT